MLIFLNVYYTGSALWELSPHAGTPNLALVAWKRSVPSVVCFLNRPVVLSAVRLWAYSHDWLCCHRAVWCRTTPLKDWRNTWSVTPKTTWIDLSVNNRPKLEEEVTCRRAGNQWRSEGGRCLTSVIHLLTLYRHANGSVHVHAPTHQHSRCRTNITRQNVAYYGRHFLLLTCHIFEVYCRTHRPTSDGL